MLDRKANKNFNFTWVSVVIALLCAGTAWAQDDYARQWAPPVGTAMPVLEAPDQSGMQRNLANLAGEQGLLLFLNRSADW